ncbi:RuBisCO operon transcriptional regulatory protein, LysR family [Bradyrhizobium sp. ORS 285]|uniref:LysR family transcriptional regulator n=1 Tax=unclassified Bradyrhizobium TaxID=2631580 RepID=UPI0002407006|nr:MULTISPECIES: LysR family transcriptional regulator [unclassified Bradyrhizobium]CCD90203.1 RuBisCO operon transcriptional regulatory protein, LysR family [Bradyrhizobium sp. ORS 285]CCD96353.1 RuBisCO operon transcriptional regulatory protein, LysR family [Bradyrhizobium sp. ORS 375]SMX60532.1 RuBisCO operon transcriptional regulatory protein, LysR family [Bradyrhizobium sp. ORS 285]
MSRHFSRDLTIRQLRALVAVQNSGSVTSAAGRLNLTQPAVTLQIRNLQELAGLPLIQRTTDGMILTEAGRSVLALAERVEAALQDCEQALDILAGRSGGRVAIGAVSTAKYFVPFAIAEFSRRFPKIDVTLRIGNRDSLREALRGYDLDIAIMGRPPADIPVDMRPFGKHPHVIIAPAGHRLARRKRIAADDLAGEVFITREPGSGTRLLMETYFAKHGLQPKTSMEMDSNETIKQAVIAGLGIAFISQHTVAHELGEGRLVTLKVVGLPIIRQWHAVRRADKLLLPPAQAMLDFFGKEGARFLPR